MIRRAVAKAGPWGKGVPIARKETKDREKKKSDTLILVMLLSLTGRTPKENGNSIFKNQER